MRSRTSEILRAMSTRAWENTTMMTMARPFQRRKQTIASVHMTASRCLNIAERNLGIAVRSGLVVGRIAVTLMPHSDNREGSPCPEKDSLCHELLVIFWTATGTEVETETAAVANRGFGEETRLGGEAEVEVEVGNRQAFEEDTDR
mmetsp:Transcript_51550/g.83631  ORF Transcript_51550/g.83631 Transcript_51550/m.83631 type:complete len:146 (+) Transcript_51550:163-600(+)